MTSLQENTSVVIIGAGVAGLALGSFLLKSGVPCVILEKRSRDHVEQRQRAGVIDTRAVRMFRAWGLEERVVGGVPSHPVLNFRIDGVMRGLALDARDHGDGRFCPQRVLVKNLIDFFTEGGGDLRFDADVVVEDVGADRRPRVRHRDGAGASREIDCDFVAGCDGDRGVSKAAFPAGMLARHAHEFGYAWLTILADVPPNHQSMMAIHPRGFAGQFMRGPQASRFYLQVPLETSPAAWPDQRIWQELEARFGEPMAQRGRVLSTEVVPIRSVVHSPMRHGRLFLLGDAAHLVPPMSAKGMSLALHDADLFAKAVVHHAEHGGDASLLDAYSDACVRHAWNSQAFAVRWNDTIHDAGDASQCGEFRRRIARAELERLFHSPTANRLFSEFMAGLHDER